MSPPSDDDDIAQYEENSEASLLHEFDTFRWEQLVPRRHSASDWMRSFSQSLPLQMLLSNALDACVNCDVPIEMDDALFAALPPSCQLDLVETRLLQNLWQTMDHLYQNISRAERGKLEKAFDLVHALRPPSRRANIARCETDIVWLERAIVREETSLLLAQQRRLEQQWQLCQRQQVEWRALSTLLAGVDFPREDDTSPTGLAYGFPIKQLGCEVVLRPSADGTVDSTSLDSCPTPADLPMDLVAFFSKVVSTKVSALMEQRGNDFQQAARQLVVFLGRLDRTLDDLVCACQQWEHEITVSDEALDLKIKLGPGKATLRMTWVAPSMTVQHFVYPTRVELIRLEGKSVLEMMYQDANPPNLRSLWKETMAKLNNDSC